MHENDSGDRAQMQLAQTRSRVLSLINGYYVSQAIYCVAALEVADHLADGPKSAEELALLTYCSPKHLGRVMLALASIGMFRENGGRFHLTPLSDCLRRHAENTIWPAAVFHGAEMYQAFGQLLHNVRSGGVAWEAEFGMPIWQYLDSRPERGVLFDNMMAGLYLNEVSAVLNAYDFSWARVIVDIGGGNGSLLDAILDRDKHLQGILLELPRVIERARKDREINPATRRRMEPGDFFVHVPPGGDLYILRHVLHDWDDESCLRILGTCRHAMQPNTRLLVIEGTSAEMSAAWTRWVDVGMMVCCGGGERTVAEYSRLLEESGFVRVRQVIATEQITLVEGRAPGA